MSTTASTTYRPQVHEHSGKVPQSAAMLCDLAYVERSIHRMLCGWGNQFLAWEDKVAVCRHVWEQACIVERLRQRIDQFPGITADHPISARHERLVNTVLCAPSFEDAVDGIYQVLNTAVVNAYLNFIGQVSDIHDAPTHQIIREIVAIKDLHRRWRSAYRIRVPHTIDPVYQQQIDDQLSAVDQFASPLPIGDEGAASPAGVNTDFRPRMMRIEPSWQRHDKHDILAWLAVDFAQSIETRQLFWPIGYMREMGLALEQLLWLYDSPDMPWDFHHDESRHMWDESRHGDSGHARMKELGINIEDIGLFHSHDPLKRDQDAQQTIPPISAHALYEALFFIGMVAETGHFRVKREAYADFRDGGDLASAEMMLYDIIDETMHVQYAHKWLPTLAKRAGIEHADYEKRASDIRKQKQLDANERIAVLQQDPGRESDPTYQRYQQLLSHLRKVAPLRNAQTCPPRSVKPM